MVFSSVAFLFYFLPVVLAAYFLAPCRIKNIVLLAASLFFYAWGEPVYVFLMIVSILLNYVVGLILDKKRSKGILGIGVAANLLILGFFKYADFLIQSINSTFSLNIATFDLALPIGISFYTFQAMSYIIDLYRDEVKLQKNLIDFATYIALFPQLIAGPIVRIKSIEEQLHFRVHNWEMFGNGVKRFVIGLAKKVLIANNAGMIWDQISAGNMSQTPVLTAWIGVLAFSLQIYFDFSGYSDMAIGLGKMFGFEFPENFRHPYMSKSITEFWRRWHISLGTWFREYVYIPLGGNKKGKVMQLVNILIVWMLTGLWHGAAWSYLIWGLYFAAILILEKTLLRNFLKKIPGFVSVIYATFLTLMSWVIFANDTVSEIVTYYGTLFGFTSGGFADGHTLYLITGNIVLFIIGYFGATDVPAKLGRRLLRIPGEESRISGIIECIWYGALLLASTGFIVASTYNPFLYFRF